METIEPWVLMLYYLLLFLALGTSLFSIFKKRNTGFALISAIIVITIPPVSMVNTIGRSQNHNEFDHLLFSIQNGEMWSIYVILGYLFSILWLTFFIFSKRSALSPLR